MKNIRKALAIILVVALLLSLAVPLQIYAAGTVRMAKKEVVLYSWYLTNPTTFWEVTDCKARPLEENYGSGDNAEFLIDENGAYILGKNNWPAYTTAGAANDVDLSDPTTKIVIEFETAGMAHLFIKASFDSAFPDNKETLFENTVDGYYRFEKNISTNSSRFATLQFGVWAGSAVTYKSAKIIKEETGLRKDPDNAVRSEIFKFLLADPNGVSASDITVSEYANTQFSDDGVVLKADYPWVGLATKLQVNDISDPSAKLVADIDNPEHALIAFKCTATNLYVENTFIEKELMLTSESGHIEIPLDNAFTEEQLKVLSASDVSFGVLLGNTGVPVTVKSLSLVCDRVVLSDVYVDLGDPESYWQIQGYPNSDEYIQLGQTRPVSGACDTGSYLLNSEEHCLTISANEFNGIWWYIATQNSICVDLRRDPVLKITVPDTADRWNIKFTCNDADFGIFNEYSNLNSGDLTLRISDYSEQLAPPTTATSDIISLGISLVVLTNGQNNKSTVFKDLKIEYPDVQNYDQVTSVEEVNITTDIENTAILPETVTVYTVNHSAKIGVEWIAPQGYSDDIPGDYFFTGRLLQRELQANYLVCEIPVYAKVSVRPRYPKGDLNYDTKLDIKDFIRIKKLFAGLNWETESGELDLNNDGRQNAEDILYLRRLLLRMPEKSIFIPKATGMYKSQGRTVADENGLVLTHTAVSFEINAYCEGDVILGIKTEGILPDAGNGLYFTVFIDGARSPERIAVLNNGNTNLTVARNLKAGSHSIEFYRQTEYGTGTATVKFVRLNGDLLPPPVNKQYYVEFIGDSLTAGFGNLTENYDSRIDDGAPLYEDGTQTYAFITAQNNSYDLSVAALSGIGIISGWHRYLMPDIYEEFPWNNYDTAREPDVIVVNLGTNDYNTKDLNGITLQEIQDGMTAFLCQLRALHPQAKIVFASGIMVDEICQYVENAVSAAGGKSEGFYYVKLSKNTSGLSAHCDLVGHQKNAEILSDFLSGIFTD